MPATPDWNGNLRRTGLRLVAQTVVLLLVMLIVLESAVYVITRHALLQSLETTLKSRAHPSAPFVLRIFRPTALSELTPRNPILVRDPRRSDASVVYLNLALHSVGRGSDYLNSIVLDPEAAQRTLKTGLSQCCSEVTYDGIRYLVYTDLVRERYTVVGIAQSSISSEQFHSTLLALQQALLAVAALGLFVLGVIGTLLARRALEPVNVSMQQQREFVSGAAHELRTPLAIMRTIGEVRLRHAVSEDEQSALIQILAQNSHLTHLVDDLSLLARGDSKGVAVQKSPVDLSFLFTETTDDIEPLAAEQGVRLVTKMQDNVQILGDALRLRQLLIILLDNALKHTPADNEIRVLLAADGGQARLQVIDAGPGIDQRHLPRIFDRFYRGDQARTGEGSGLGLSIAKWVVEAHDGRIHAGNVAEGGAIFTVTVPILHPHRRHPDRKAMSGMQIR